MTELDRKNWFLPRTFHRSSSVTAGLAKLLIFYFTSRDRPLSKPHDPWPIEVDGPWNPKLLNHPLSKVYRVYLTGSKTRNENAIIVYTRIYSNTEFAFTSVETSRKRISDIIKISSKITSDLGYHETATLNKSLVILKSGVNSRVRVATSLK